MRTLFDVNLLIALTQPDHLHHDRAHAWWEAHRNDGWASCPLTQNGFVRIVSQPHYPQPVPVAHALDVLAEQIARTDHAFWPDDLSLIDAEWFDRTHLLGPKRLTDVYLLAVAVKNGGRLATFDRSVPIAAVRRAEERHLVVV